MTTPLILITNDDGIESPGLVAVAAALDGLGELLIVAPTRQQSGMGRSMPPFYDGRIFETTIGVGDASWAAYRANASPAQAVQYGILELAERIPALVVSGINYGENIGTGVTVSGTVGAAMEAAAHGIPALAVSLQVPDPAMHLNNDASVDFSVAMYFTRYFAERWLKAKRPPEVDLLKIDIPAGATRQTPWRLTRLERKAYVRPLKPTRVRLDEEWQLSYEVNREVDLTPDSDASLLRQGIVSVTPLTIDITSRIKRETLRALLDGASPNPQS